MELGETAEFDEAAPLRSESNASTPLNLAQLRSNSDRKWKILLYGCISWMCLFHTTVCISAIQEDISNILSLSDVEFSLLSTVILALTAMMTAPFATAIINRWLDDSIYHGVIFGNVVIFISQIMFVIIISVSHEMDKNGLGNIALLLCYSTRIIAGFGIGINFSCLNSLQSIWFSKSEYVSIAAQLMDLSIEAGATVAKYSYIAIYRINNQLYQPFLMSVIICICAIICSIMAKRDELEFINNINKKFNTDIDNLMLISYTRTESKDNNSNSNSNSNSATPWPNSHSDDINIVNRLSIICKWKLKDNVTLLCICILSFGIASGFYNTIYSQTEISFIYKFNFTDYQAETVLATLPLCKIITGPLCGWINAKLITYIINDHEDRHNQHGHYNQHDHHHHHEHEERKDEHDINSNIEIEKKTITMFAIGCIIGAILLVVCGLIYILSNQENNSQGLNVAQPWIFIVCFSFADSIYFGSAFSIIYVLTPTQYTSLFNGIAAMANYLFIALLTCLFEIVIEFSSYDSAWIFITLLAVISGLLQAIIITVIRCI